MTLVYFESFGVPIILVRKISLDELGKCVEFRRHQHQLLRDRYQNNATAGKEALDDVIPSLDDVVLFPTPDRDNFLVATQQRFKL